MRKILIIAGNHAEYERFIQQNELNPSLFEFADSAQQLAANAGGEYVLAGESWKNPLMCGNFDPLKIYKMEEIVKAKLFEIYKIE